MAATASTVIAEQHQFSKQNPDWVNGAVIVGATPPGLAAGAHLRGEGVPVVILEEADLYSPFAAVGQNPSYGRLRQFFETSPDQIVKIERVESAKFDGARRVWRVNAVKLGGVDGGAASVASYVSRWLVVAPAPFMDDRTSVALTTVPAVDLWPELGTEGIEAGWFTPTGLDDKGAAYSWIHDALRAAPWLEPGTEGSEAVWFTPTGLDDEGAAYSSIHGALRVAHEIAQIWKEDAKERTLSVPRQRFNPSKVISVDRAHA